MIVLDADTASSRGGRTALPRDLLQRRNRCCNRIGHAVVWVECILIRLQMTSLGFHHGRELRPTDPLAYELGHFLLILVWRRNGEPACVRRLLVWRA